MPQLAPVYETCQPRSELLQGTLPEDLFAAKIRPVVRGTAPEVYQNADRFFANTFPTDGISTLIREVFSRLAGQDSGSPVIRLETSFGGGKTHDEIALWHICKQGRQISGLDRFTDINLIPERPINIAAIDGRDLDISAGNHYPETGITTYTIWGELAYQIGGIRGYELLKGSDETGISPGTSVLERLVGEEPTVIVIDEIARHLRAAKGKQVSDSNLAKQVVAFLFSLMDFAASSHHVVLVYSLASDSDTFSEETQELTELRKSSARQERVLSPSTDVEIYSIVKQRLFESVSEEAAQNAAAAYTERYRQSRFDLPEACLASSYRETFAKSYPFHPELFQLLTKKIASIPDFQRTRGALRLLGWVVQQIWKDCPRHATAIHVHHVPLGVNSRVTNDLTSRIQRQLMRPAIEADIYNSTGREAYAQVQDKDWLAADKPPMTTWVARTIFLHSLTQGLSSGIRKSELYLSLLTPGYDIGVVDDVLDKLLAVAWHLDYDPLTSLAQFKEEPSINKIITEEMNVVAVTAAKEELRKRRDSMLASRLFELVIPDSPADVDDKPDSIVLCLIDFQDATLHSTDEGPPDLLERIFNQTGESGKFRTYRNRLLFLVANQGEIQTAIKRSQEYLAIQGILKNPRRVQDLSESQQRELKQRSGQSELNLRLSLCNAYRHLFYPAKDDVKAPTGLIHYPLPPQDASTLKKNQQEVILKALRDCHKVRPEEDDLAKPFAPAYVLQKVWLRGLEAMTTRALRDEFSKNLALNLPIEAEIPKLRQTFERGILEGQWDLKVGDRIYMKTPDNSPKLPPIEFSDRQTLYRRGVLEPPKPRQVELTYQLLGTSETEQQVELSWQAPEAISTQLFCNGEALEQAFKWRDNYRLPITQDSRYRVVASYKNEETAEQEVVVSIFGKSDGQDGTGVDRVGTGSEGYRVPVQIRQTEFSRDGTPNGVFNDFGDFVQDNQVKTIHRLKLSVAMAMDYRKLGTTIPLLNSLSKNITIDQSLSIRAAGQFLRLEYEGDIRGFQACFSTANSFLNQKDIEVELSLSVHLSFDPAIEPSSNHLQKIQQNLTRNPVERLSLWVQVGY